MTMRKYFGDLGGPAHNNANLHWPGTMDGFPVAGGEQSLNLKQEEVENLDLQYDFKSSMFELWDAQQKAAFDEINDRIINGWYRLLKRSDHWDEQKQHFRVWLEWFQIYGMLPGKKG